MAEVLSTFFTCYPASGSVFKTYFRIFTGVCFLPRTTKCFPVIKTRFKSIFSTNCAAPVRSSSSSSVTQVRRACAVSGKRTFKSCFLCRQTTTVGWRKTPPETQPHAGQRVKRNNVVAFSPQVTEGQPHGVLSLKLTDLFHSNWTLTCSSPEATRPHLCSPVCF